MEYSLHLVPLFPFMSIIPTIFQLYLLKLQSPLHRYEFINSLFTNIYCSFDDNQENTTTLVLTAIDHDVGTLLTIQICQTVSFGTLQQANGSTINSGDNVATLNQVSPTDVQGIVLYTPQPFVPAQNTSFTFKAIDSEGTQSSCMEVDVIVIYVHDAPVALGATVQTKEDTPFFITLHGYSDANSSLSFTITRLPSRGNLYQSNSSVTPISTVPTVVQSPQGTVWFAPLLRKYLV